MVNKSRNKGTAAETAVSKYLNSRGVRCVRKPLRGAKDEGDLDIYPYPVVVEVKNCARMELASWVNEAEAEKKNADLDYGVVWHKKKGTSDPGSWYVTMNGKTFTDMLLRLGV